MKRFSRHGFSLIAALAALAGLVALAPQATEYARNGLRLCAMVVIPSLLPFFVLSSLLSALGLPQLLGRLFEKPMRALFKVSGEGLTPLLLGLTGGYPVGAAALAALVREGRLSREEGERLLPVCNNTGPAFIIGAAGVGVFGSTRWGVLLYICHLLAALTLGVLFSRKQVHETDAPPPPQPSADLLQALPDSVRTAATQMLSLCGFVVFFAVITGLLDELGLLSSLAADLSLRLGWELGACRALLTGILELSGGIGAMRGLSPTASHLALAAFLLGFGGISVHCQTLSAVEGSGMKSARHTVGRLLHGVLSAIFAYAFFMLLRI